MKRPIGIYDSGVGGISVLREAIRLLPNEDYIYFGDTKNAPYGEKGTAQVQLFAWEAAQRLISQGAKAIVIACNTATSAAAAVLRGRLNIPIIGMEPALKPASMLRHTGKILVLATTLTLKLPKFESLMALYGEGAVPIACPGLMEFVENGVISGDEIEAYLKHLLNAHLKDPIDAVVLGCTHYIFLRETLLKLLPEGTSIIDGNEGTVRQLERKLAEDGLLETAGQAGSVRLTTSGDEQLVLPVMERLLHL